MLRNLLLAVALLATPALASAQWVEGRHYVKLDGEPSGADGKIEVIEAFWYGCPSCFAFEPHLNRWLANKPGDVEFKRIAATMSPSWRTHARAYYAAEVLGVVDKVHDKMFRAIHLERKRMDDVESLAALFQEHAGVSPEEFGDTYRGFGVERRMRAGDALTRRYRMGGVPTVVVNGRYRTDATSAGGYDKLAELIAYLVAQERKARQD